MAILLEKTKSVIYNVIRRVMKSIENSAVTLIGFGVSNRELCQSLISNGVYPSVRCESTIDLPDGIRGIFDSDYLNTVEDIIFRSPVIRPDRIKGRGKTYTELSYSLEIAPSFKIGITGSDGKTTTSSLVYEMLQGDKREAVLCGNIGEPLCKYADTLSRDAYIVAEISSFQLMDAEPSLDIAIVTNVSPNHLDWHRDMDEYIRAKAKITKNAKRVVLNYDNEITRSMGKRCRAVTYFSLNDLSAERFSGDRVYIKNGYVMINSEPIFKTDTVRLKGKFNLQNVLAAVACVYQICKKESICDAVRNFGGVPCRMETVDLIDGVTYIDSSIDSTPTRTKNTLCALPLDKTVCIMGGYNKGLSYEILRDELKSLYCVILCGESSTEIEGVYPFARIVKVNTLNEAVRIAHKIARSGDTVILSPASASFDMFKNYKEKSKKYKEAIRGLKNG